MTRNETISNSNNIYDMLGINYNSERSKVGFVYKNVLMNSNINSENRRKLQTEFEKYFRMTPEEYNAQMESSYGKEFDRETEQVFDMINRKHDNYEDQEPVENTHKNSNFGEKLALLTTATAVFGSGKLTRFNKDKTSRKYTLRKERIIAGALFVVMLITGAKVYSILNQNDKEEAVTTTSVSQQVKYSFQYKVEYGDTIWDIAKRFGCDISDIHYEDGTSIGKDIIYEGQVIYITTTDKELADSQQYQFQEGRSR